MANNFIKIEVYYFSDYLGSFYADCDNKKQIIEQINKKYGSSNWTNYNIGN